MTSMPASMASSSHRSSAAISLGLRARVGTDQLAGGDQDEARARERLHGSRVRGPAPPVAGAGGPRNERREIAQSGDGRDHADAADRAADVRVGHPRPERRHRVRKEIAVPEAGPRRDDQHQPGFNEIRGDEQSSDESDELLPGARRVSRASYQTGTAVETCAGGWASTRSARPRRDGRASRTPCGGRTRNADPARAVPPSADRASLWRGSTQRRSPWTCRSPPTMLRCAINRSGMRNPSTSTNPGSGTSPITACRMAWSDAL